LANFFRKRECVEFIIGIKNPKNPFRKFLGYNTYIAGSRQFLPKKLNVVILFVKPKNSKIN
jgi:hypothetical protein